MTTIIPGELIPAATINQWSPPGIMSDFAGATAPDGWLLCDGASYLRADYPELFAVITTIYGAADGTHFNVPDCRGRVPVGYAAAGGHADVAALGANEGVAAANRRAKHKHTPHGHSGNTGTESVAHTHDVPLWVSGAGAGSPNVAQGDNQAVPIADGAATTTAESANHYHAFTTGSVDGGSGNANDALDAPAYIVLNKIIRAKDVT